MFAKQSGESGDMAELNAQLAAAVTWWMQRHALSQTVIAARGGPSTSTLTKITQGVGSVRPSVLAGLDEGLGWGTGVAARYLAGEDPLGIDSASTTAPEEWPDEQLINELARRLRTRGREGETDASTAEAREKITELGRWPKPGTRAALSREPLDDDAD